LYDPKTGRKERIIRKDLDKDATDVLKDMELVLSKRSMTASCDEMPIYLKRKGDIWVVEDNLVQAKW
jgi:hypothetical protein